MRSFNIFFTTMMKGLEVVATFMLFCNEMFWIGEYITLKYEYSLKRSSVCFESNEYLCDPGIDDSYSAGIFLFLYLTFMHNNFLKNMRLAFSIAMPMCCFCCWHPINCLICKIDRLCKCRKICQDQFFKFHTIVKWLLFTVMLSSFYTRLDDYQDLINTNDYDVNW